MMVRRHRHIRGYMSNYGSEIDTFSESVDGIDTWAGMGRFVEVAPTGRMAGALVRESMDAKGEKDGRFRNRRGHVLFIDARRLGRLLDRTRRELTEDEVARIARTYHAWRGEQDAGTCQDIPGFCKSASLEEIGKHGHVLTPGRYVGAKAKADDGEPFAEMMQRLTATLRAQIVQARRLDEAIDEILSELGYGAK